MKTLYIARHAKSDWGQPGFTDFERPLNETGLRDAALMANYLSSIGMKVDAIMSSMATRAISTAQSYADKILDADCLIKVDAIYQADEQDMLAIINKLPENFNTIMLVGHNPTFSLLVELLTGEAINMSAGSVVEIKIAMDDWAAVTLNTAVLGEIMSPKSLSH